MANTTAYFSGTSGLILPIPKRLFPPAYVDKSRLNYYASLFNSLEVNSSFYKLPMVTTVGKWTADVPPGFRFTYKLWREITHAKGLAFNPADVVRFMQTIAGADDKKGCLLVQFPPSVTIANKPQLEKLLETIREADTDCEWQVAVEFRHKSWYRDDVYQLLESNGASLVLQDKPASVTPMINPLASFVYLRFHGPGGSYRGSYADDFLYEYAQYIKEWLADEKTVYVYFNNTMGEAIKNLQTLNRFVAEAD